MPKKIKKFAPALPLMSKFFFLWGTKGKKTSFFKPPLGPPKEKKMLMGGRPGAFLLIFFGNFFKHVKKIFNFWNVVKIKVAKFKLNHFG